MERPERYDPEDLEHLMLERPFDELLEEERAYALRHLADRAEYERMRALLHHVRTNDRNSGTLDASPKVRENVLQAFREQRRPHWRIWLNSVGGFLLPERPVHYWRPALALGVVAVLSFTGVEMWNSLQHKENKVLAEVKPKATVQPPEAPKEQNETENRSGSEQNAAPPAPLGSLPVAADGDEADGAAHSEEAGTAETVIGSSNAMEASPTMQADKALAETAVAPTPDVAETVKPRDDLATAPAAVAAKEPRIQSSTNEDQASDEPYPNNERKREVATTSARPNEDALLGLLRAAW